MNKARKTLLHILVVLLRNTIKHTIASKMEKVHEELLNTINKTQLKDFNTNYDREHKHLIEEIAMMKKQKDKAWVDLEKLYKMNRFDAYSRSKYDKNSN